MFKQISILLFVILSLPILVFASVLPPSYPVAVNDQDRSIPLFWFEPEAQIESIAYEEEMDSAMVVDCNWYHNSAGVRFTLSQDTALLHKVKIFVSYYCEACPDYDYKAPFNITINQNNDTIPGDTIFGPILCQAQQTTPTDSGEWVEIQLDQIIKDKDFWVMFHWLENSGSSPSLGVDVKSGSSHSVFGWKENGYQEWFIARDYDFRIRAEVITENQSYQADSFVIYRSEDSSQVYTFENRIATLPNTAFQYVDSELSNGQSYFYKITSQKNQVESSPSNLIFATPRSPAKLNLFPDSLYCHLGSSDSQSVDIDLTNYGGLALDFNLKLNIFPDSVIRGADGYGYVWSEKQFDWVDIKTRGVLISTAPDTNNYTYGPFHFPFQLPFYGNNFDSIFICTNGWISFTSNRTDWNNTELPCSRGPFNLIAPLWDDLKLTSGSGIYFLSKDDSLVILFDKMQRRISGGDYTFEVILTPDGEITFQYLTLNGIIDSCSVGTENEDGSFGLNLAYNQEFLTDSTALSLMPGWVNVSPKKGKIEPQEQENLKIVFKSGALQLREYRGEIIISARDKNKWLAPVFVPLVLEIDSASGVNSDEILVPNQFLLEQNYPNPFNLSTNIRYIIGERASLPISLRIYNLKGQLVRSFKDIPCARGKHCITWDGKNNLGRVVASGVYFYKVEAGKFSQTKKMLLIK